MDRGDARRATFFIMAVFLFQPLALGGWLALIPVVKSALGLSKSELAIGILGAPAATLITLQLGGRLVSRIGPRHVFRWVFPVQGAAFLLPLAADKMATLFAALFVCGAAIAMLEVAINVYAGRVEKHFQVTIMSRCHGLWAAGLMSGSAVVTWSGGSYAAVALLAAVSGLAGAAAGFAMPKVGKTGTSGSAPRRKIRDVPRILPIIALFMLMNTITEGAMGDWSAVYLAERLPAGATHAGFAVTLFAAFMTGGRFLGDWLKRRMGSVGLARLTGGFAFLGLSLLVLPLPLWLAYPGFACVGFGISVAYPLGVSATAALDDAHESQNIALMATVALSGFLLGPPAIGFLAEAYSLRAGLAILLPGLLLAFWLSGALSNNSRSGVVAAAE